MSTIYSKAYKISVVASVEEEGLSRRAAAGRFGVSVASAVRWCQQYGKANLKRELVRIEDRERDPEKELKRSLYEGASLQCLASLHKVREWLADQGHVLGNREAWLPCCGAERKSKGYSLDLRNRVVAAIEVGSTRRAAAARYGVGVATAVRWHQRFRLKGNVLPFPMGGNRRSGRAQALAGTITGWVVEQPAITIAEIRERLAAQGNALSHGVVWRLLVREGYTVKKITVHASEHNRDDVKIKRREWEKIQPYLSTFDLIFVDEFCVNTKMARTRGRALRGKRCVAHIPHGHWKTSTVVAALSADGIIDYQIFDGAMNGERFRTWMAELAKKLGAGNLVICDNLAAHKVKGIREILQKKGADIRYLPPYSPQFNPIEKAISQLKSHLRKVEARTVEDLHAAVKKAANRVTATHARNYFKSCGYEVHAAT